MTGMAPSSLEDELNRQGLFIDDVNRLRVLEPSIADKTILLKKQCDQFLTSKLFTFYFVSE